MHSPKTTIPVNRKILFICLAIIFLTVLSSNFWRLKPHDSDSALAVSLYTEILKHTTIVGIDFSCLTTTLGYYPAKRVSEDPLTAAFMVKILKDAGVSENSVVAINASGSFPGFTLASLAACAALGIETYVIASIGSSTYGANIPGNTIADMLLQESVRRLGHTLLAVTPGGSNDHGMELDPEELQRISQMLESQGIPFIRPNDLGEAIALRESLFAGSTLLINIGGNHASSGANEELSLMSGILNQSEVTDNVNRMEEPGLIQFFLRSNMPVIQILNVRRLYADYGLDFDQNGQLFGNRESLLR